MSRLSVYAAGPVHSTIHDTPVKLQEPSLAMDEPYPDILVQAAAILAQHDLSFERQSAYVGIPFVKLQEPSHPIDRYIPGGLVQPASVPRKYLDAMRVRNAVFVQDQGFQLHVEPDADDPRSYHLIAYAPLNERSKTPPTMPHFAPMVPVSSGSTPSPMATIRIVPFPHLPHPEVGETFRAQPLDTGDDKVERNPPPFITDRQTDFHDGSEPYLKLGRLAVVRHCRKRKVGRTLVQTALNWLCVNANLFNPPFLEMPDTETCWRGLVCVHAQLDAKEFWVEQGFTVDNTMGLWYEEEVAHVGMWLRLGIPGSNVPGPNAPIFELRPMSAIAFNSFDIVEDTPQQGTVPPVNHHIAHLTSQEETPSGFGLGEGEDVPSQKASVEQISAGNPSSSDDDDDDDDDMPTPQGTPTQEGLA